MRSRYQRSGHAMEIRVDYVESKLDETIKSLKESISESDARHKETMKSFKESNNELEARHKETMKSLKESIEKSEARLAADREASEARLAADREEFKLRFAEERKEWRSTKRWLYLNFGGVIALILTVVIAIIGFFVTNGNM